MHDDCLLLFDFADQAGRHRRMCFGPPAEVIAATTPGQVGPALRAVRQATQRGYFAAGFIRYEAAPAFDPALRVRAGPAGLPLLWFGLFAAPQPHAPAPPGAYQIGTWQPDTSRARYADAVAAIRAAIERGETYQVNYTMRLHASFAGDDLAFYEQIRAAQAASYCAYLRLGRYRILSASPELFFRWDGRQIVTRPMKGTAPRGRWPAEDQQLAEWLAASEKNRAENLMIVDLLRNDLGRVARIGSVQVPRLFELERYHTVHQLTSTVTALTRAGVQLEDIVAALFPCGSITGAPKIATMKLIDALEGAPRGVYCGAIGLIEPGGEAVFNVAIRTLTLDSHTGAAEYGVGGGITWDSTAPDEYAEALLKAALLSERWPAFELLETLRLADGAYTLRDRHLARLAESAGYFGIPLDLADAVAALAHAARTAPAGPQRVRLLVAPDGAARAEHQPLAGAAQPGAPLPVAWAHAPISTRDRFLYHKTTYRAVYDDRRAERPGMYDVLLWNERGEATEFTIGNLVAEIDGQRYTPPIASGLLPGTLRAELLARREIAERVLTRADVARATQLWLINSVRGWVAVRLVRALEQADG